MDESNPYRRFPPNRQLWIVDSNGRIDMLVKFKKQEFALEIKIKRDKISIEEGKEQLAEYLDRLGLTEGYLVIFDTGKKKWEQKIYYKDIVYNNKKIVMVGL